MDVEYFRISTFADSTEMYDCVRLFILLAVSLAVRDTLPLSLPGITFESCLAGGDSSVLQSVVSTHQQKSSPVEGTHHIAAPAQ
jgi:hypothetical protein